MEPDTPRPAARTGTDDVTASAVLVPPGRAEQAALPLDLPASAPVAKVEPSSPPAAPETAGTDTAHDQPIGFALTARARRAVAPGTLPELSVVGVGATGSASGNGALEEPDDTRPARARALRRAGVPLSAIVRQLGTDPLTVTAWVGEVAPSTRQHRSGGSGAAVPTGVPPDRPTPGDGGRHVRRHRHRHRPRRPARGAHARGASGADAAAGWEVVEVRAAALNHHDLWTLRGVGIDPAGCRSCSAATPAGSPPTGARWSSTP
jgi:hypothetical protein